MQQKLNLLQVDAENLCNDIKIKLVPFITTAPEEDYAENITTKINPQIIEGNIPFHKMPVPKRNKKIEISEKFKQTEIKQPSGPDTYREPIE